MIDTMDMVQEMRLRRWARENFVSADDRSESWHQIVLDEMARIDSESTVHSEQSGLLFGAESMTLGHQIAPAEDPALNTHEGHAVPTPQYPSAPTRSMQYGMVGEL